MIKVHDQQLLAAAQGGDMNAFAELFEPMRPVLVRVAASITGENEAEDVVMESMLKIWRSMGGFRQGSSLRTWAIRIVRNTAIDVQRSRARKREVALDAPLDLKDDSGTMIDLLEDENVVHPFEQLADAERHQAVAEVLAKLDPLHRQTLELRFIDDLSYREIAAATGVSIGTVMSRLFNAKRKLGRLMGLASTSRKETADRKELVP